MKGLVLLALVACAPPQLLGRGDAVFARAQERLVRAEAEVARAQPAPAERALFLQAEGLWRFRFGFPPRGFLSYLAQGAAAITDFPALESLAGSLDLADLRLRTSDGAVQLWETLAAARGPLRPLSLYRLGWAYRSAGASGLPRSSGDEAFQELIHDQPGTPLATLSLEALKTPWKSKGSATAWSLIPGLGQIYVGETGNGLARLGVALAAAALVAVPVVVAARRTNDLTWRGDWPLLATGLGGLALLSIDYTAAWQDAQRGVVEFNERQEAAFEDHHPDAP